MRPGGLFGGETSLDKNRVSFSEIPSAYIKEKNIDKCVEFMQKALSVDENVKDRDTQIRKF